MNQNSLPRFGGASLGVFVSLFVFVFFAVVIIVTLITFILPESYAGTARVKVKMRLSASAGSLETNSVQTEVEVIKSEAVLGKVVADLNLNEIWGEKYVGGGRLKTTESLGILKNRMSVRRIRETSIIEIRTFSEDRSESASLANKIAEVYADRVRVAPNDDLGVEIIDRATPSVRPVRPNKPLNIILGMGLGAVLGALTGGVGAALARSRQVKDQRPPAIP